MTEYTQQNILLVRSCRNDFFLEALKYYREKFPNESISLLLLPKMKPDEHLYELADNIIYFPDASSYHNHPDARWLKVMEEQCFSQGVITLNNRHGEGYTPLKCLLFACGCKEVQTINHDLEIKKQKEWQSKFPGIAIKQATHTLFTGGVYLLSLFGMGLFALVAFLYRPQKNKGEKE